MVWCECREVVLLVLLGQCLVRASTGVSMLLVRSGAEERRPVADSVFSEKPRVESSESAVSCDRLSSSMAEPCENSSV